MDKIFLVKKDFINSRIDRWIKKNICHVPQSCIEKNLRNKSVTVNKLKVKSSYKLEINDKIYIKNFNPRQYNLILSKKYIPSKRDIKDSEDLVVENNENFCIINKPYGLAVQGGSKIKKNLVDLIAKNRIFLNSKPFIVHRLDKETSGIIIIAKNRKYAQLFTSLFRIRKIHKSYLGIVVGDFNKSKGTLIDDLYYYEGNKKIKSRAITHFTLMDSNNNYSLLKLNPETGRKHQLRKQLLMYGNPILGDEKYNLLTKKNKNMKNLMLHAHKIYFKINDLKYNFTAEIPEYFNRFLKEKHLKIY